MFGFLKKKAQQTLREVPTGWKRLKKTDLESVRKQYRKEIGEIWESMEQWNTKERPIYFDSIVDSVLAYCLELPASENSHHSEDGGLIEHTLDVAQRAVFEIKKERPQVKRDDGSPDPIESERHAKRASYMAFI
ncbi:MAG: TraI domain-containing protein, partial [Planctomycetes bacterium]|nr:TraI domain-containing protein [Planctomycetota bacterium]